MVSADDKEKRLSTPIVLIAASAMISIGVVAFLGSGAVERAGGEEPTADVVRASVDTSSPGRAAESFLDAWRKRDHEAARALSIEGAEREVLLRMARESNASPEDLRLKRQVWDAMAADRLELEVDEERVMDDGATRISGVARGDFLGAPYARRVGFEVVEREGAFVVRTMTLGLVLSDTPEFLNLPSSPEPR